MHIEVANNNGTKYLKLARCHRGTNSKGKKTIVKQTVLNIGPLSRFDDGRDDYLGRLRQSFKDGKPLIEALLPYVGGGRPAEYVIRYREGDPECTGKAKLLAPCVLDPVFSALGLDSLFATIKHAGKMEYDLTGIVRLLVYGRILEPASKLSTMRQNDGYFIPPVAKAGEFNVYDALSVIDANADRIFRRMNTSVVQGAGRNPKVVFYDVTNFFFEIPDADGDVLDDKGEVGEKGLRKYGPSKESRKQPIVQVGLFMDDNGIPISFKTFPGNTLDHHTLRPAMTETVDEFGHGLFILIADRGMYSGTNMCHVTDAGNGYIVSKSLRKSNAAERKWTTSPENLHSALSTGSTPSAHGPGQTAAHAPKADPHASRPPHGPARPSGQTRTSSKGQAEIPDPAARLGPNAVVRPQCRRHRSSGNKPKSARGRFPVRAPGHGSTRSARPPFPRAAHRPAKPEHAASPHSAWLPAEKPLPSGCRRPAGSSRPAHGLFHSVRSRHPCLPSAMTLFGRNASAPLIRPNRLLTSSCCSFAFIVPTPFARRGR